MNAITQELQPREVAVLDNTPASLLMIAVQRGADVDQLGKLLDLQQRHDAEQARKSFAVAKVAFQAACPQINKDREVSFPTTKGTTKYKYATLAGIADQVREPLSACGLSYRWEINDPGELIQVTCILSHIDGHSERNAMSAMPDDSGSKNAIQQRGSTVTYLQRYTLIGSLGIASANEDDDGKSTGEDFNTDKLRAHNDVLRERFESVWCIKGAIASGDWGVAVEAWHELTEDEHRALWIAPTKGGIFTTAERDAMKSNEWVAARTTHFGETK